jgi:UDP:flavonoid glycosyltransferase YjiC (YdhE family)
MSPAAAFFAMPQEGHFHNLRPIISGLAARGITAHVFTDRGFQGDVERAGGRFVDLFGRYPLECADDESHPAPCRFVSFAGRYAEEIIRDLEEIGVSLVVYDEHAVIGRVAGAALGIPYVSVSPAHNVSPARVEALLHTLPRIHVAPGCTRAVTTLRDRYGVRDASPFSFASGLSPFLNVYGEPAVYLTEAERRAFEPVAFHGCLPSIDEIEATRRDGERSHFGGDPGALKLYVSFGTVVWRYWPAEAFDAVAAISSSLGELRDVSAVISLGGAEVGADAVAAIAKPNVSIAGYVDQWEILQEADAFVTHNGLRSTHEAIVNGVPMISYPFFWDQPALAAKCRQFGLAVPLTSAPRSAVTDEDLRRALSELDGAGESLRASLAKARDWELEVIANRDSVLRRITDLIPA